MASADFCTFSPASLPGLHLALYRPPRVSYNAFISYICQIYKNKFRVVLGLRFELQTCPLVPASYLVSVRQTEILPPASFRFYLTADTLAFG
jgi:hypothetical protein